MINFDDDFSELIVQQISPKNIDLFWADGWRNFGAYFFRNKFDYNAGNWLQILPLRINIEKFSFNKNQTKLLKKQANTLVKYQTIQIDERRNQIFEDHISRFKDNIPETIYTFLGQKPGIIPCQALECALYDDNMQLYATSFFGVGQNAISSTYAMFDTQYAALSPGLHTLLLEIIYAQNHQKKYVYTGYCHREDTIYAYKKRFNGLEYYDWEGSWHDFVA